MKKLRIVVFVFFLFCKDEKSITKYLEKTSEITQFCSQMIPCIHEEIEKAFQNHPQQKHYLLSKATLKNCQHEQAQTLESLLKPNQQQVETLSKIYQQGFPLSLLDIAQYFNDQQKVFLLHYGECSKIIYSSPTCDEKKKTLKSHSSCFVIYQK
ncbi:MAG: hypothetical protein NZ853_02765 [Leptospiraceae bacterium]|nr:hypothetical protein [Leptospiraceae bacterium]MDW7975101.1 hypothetical protein [Leptospiraceae bacterium]